MKERLEERLRRLGIEADVSLTPSAYALRGRSLLALTSSHLGTSIQLHAEVCRYISRSMIDVRQAGHVLLIAADSAIEPWAIRAADLFSVATIRVHINGGDPTGDHDRRGARIDVRSTSNLSRDEVVVALADRVDCVFARAKGNIEKSLQLRLDH